jgi:ABC-type transporter Mla subunit MlaD
MGRFTAIRNFIVGAVFLGSLIVFGYVTVRITGEAWGDNVNITVPFDRVNGLKIGNEVRIYGYRVGTVEKIRLDPTEIARPKEPKAAVLPIDVTMRIPLDVRKVLPPDTRFVVKSLGALGGSYVEIQTERKDKVGAGPGGAERKAGEAKPTGAVPQEPVRVGRAVPSPLIPPLDPPQETNSFFIRTAEAQEPPAPGTKEFTGTSDEELFGKIGQVIEENRENLKATIEEIRNVVKAINEQKGPIGALVLDEEMKNQLKNAVKRADEIITTIADGKGTIGKLVNDPKVYDDIQDAIGRLKTMVADADAGKGTLGKLLRDEDLSRKLSDSVGHFEEIVAKVNGGVGTAGQIVNNREAWDRLVYVLRNVQEAVEDFREQAPINTFVNAVFAAF